MPADLSPLRRLLVTLTGWINRHQQRAIDYLGKENRVLKEQLRRRLPVNKDDRLVLTELGRLLLARRFDLRGNAHHPSGRNDVRRARLSPAWSSSSRPTVLAWHRRGFALYWRWPSRTARRDLARHPIGPPRVAFRFFDPADSVEQGLGDQFADTRPISVALESVKQHEGLGQKQQRIRGYRGPPPPPSPGAAAHRGRLAR
jgi:hypothetical protein